MNKKRGRPRANTVQITRRVTPEESEIIDQMLEARRTERKTAKALAKIQSRK